MKSFAPFVMIWALLLATVLALFVWRKLVSSQEDDNLHVMDGASVEKSAQQSVLAQKLEVIDRWGKIATVAAVAYGLVLGGLYMWQTWIQNSSMGI